MLVISLLFFLFYGLIAIKRFEELRPHYSTYCNGTFHVKSKMERDLSVIVSFSKDNNFNDDDCISFDFRLKNSVRIYFIPPDTLYVEGYAKILSNEKFKIIKLDNWPFNFEPRNDFSVYALLNKYTTYRDSVLLGSKGWINIYDF